MKAGDIDHVKYPFVRCKITLWDEEGAYEVNSWRPGCNCETDDGGYPDWWAEGHGEMILEIVSIHKPGKYPERVFYTRKWRDPSGTVFGKPGLKMTTTANYKRLKSGFRHEYEYEDSDAA